MRERRRPSEQLSLAEVCERLGDKWVAPATGKPTQVHIKKLKRRLRRVEAEQRVRLVFGGGRPGRSGGGPCWTTWYALQRAGLVDEFRLLHEQLGARIDEVEAHLEEALHRDRDLAERVHSRDVAFAGLRRRVERLEQRP